ncbi:HNH endonuclease signature motif containing protein [Methanosphaera sp. WGK6]|uniref:HNH endonuclease n=1 Tax=Methanosphaera sp. WGK6 TaxID=1561964 RepID=UPI00084C3139|nr:HNH endonuclease signature motif containing protein [Methanosphaera sp. WGK6]OED30395.1 hypothetical protein NL43_03235 [Methanosphaera sp. WGK6]
MAEKYRWQVAGNGNPFDSNLEFWDSNKMSTRSIGVLEFFKENGPITVSNYEESICNYLKENYKLDENKSNKRHFYRPLEFVGFIRNIDDELSLSVDGKNFLEAIKKKDYIKAKEFYLYQLLQSSYPNSATKSVKLSLYPFRIIFKLLLEEPIPVEWFLYRIPYIRNYEDFKNRINIHEKEYDKWKTWVLPYWEKWNIIEYVTENDIEKIKLVENKRDFLNGFLKEETYENMFFKTDFQYVSTKSLKKHTRNYNLSVSVLEKSRYNCFFDKNHITFPSKSRPNYVEAHHIIPLARENSFQSVKLDCKENIIPLCPNCHRKIHYAKMKSKENMLEHMLDHLLKFEKFKKLNLDINDLKEFYSIK